MYTQKIDKLDGPHRSAQYTFVHEPFGKLCETIVYWKIDIDFCFSQQLLNEPAKSDTTLKREKNFFLTFSIEFTQIIFQFFQKSQDVIFLKLCRSPKCSKNSI